MDVQSDVNKNSSTEEKQESHEPKNIGTALETLIKHVGEMGLYQRLLFIIMLPFGVLWSFVYFVQMFITATPQEHWCYVPELGGLDAELRRNLSIPGTTQNTYDHCLMYDANWTLVLETLTPPDIGTPTIACQNGWEFLFDDIPYSTVVNEREWVCDRENLVPWAQTIAFSGSIVGGIVCGPLADAFGRIPLLVFTNLLGCLGGVATIFTTGFWDFSICRFIVGMSCDSCFLLIYILVLEYVGTGHRTWVANLSIAFYFGGGCLILPWLALWINDWKNLTLATSVPMAIVIVTPFIVPESTRWLVSKGRIDKAVSVIKKFEKINRTKIPHDVMDEFVTVAKTTKEKEESVMILIKTPSLRPKLAYLIIAFMSCALVFDGLVRLSETLGLDFFLTFTITSATEIPSIALVVVLLDRYGRRMLVCVPMVLAGLLSFVTAFVPRGAASVTLAVAARFFTNMSYSAIIQWTPELLPTSARASGASLVHVSGFVAVALSPFVVYSERAWDGLPLILVAAAGFAAGGVALLLPETTGRPMPQTIEDWERLAKSGNEVLRNRVTTERSRSQIGGNGKDA